MSMLSEDDLNLRDMTDAELDRAWDLWFDLAQVTNEWDPPYTHGVLAGIEARPTNGQETTSDHARSAGELPGTRFGQEADVEPSR